VSTTTVAAVQMQRAPSYIRAANVTAMKVSPEMDTTARVSIVFVCAASAY